MSSKSGATEKSLGTASDADALRIQQNKLVVSLVELIESLTPKGNTPEAKCARKAARLVREKMIEECLA